MNVERLNYIIDHVGDSIKRLEEETPTSVDILKQNVILGVWTEKPIVILLKGKEIADSFKIYFDNMWKIARN